MSNGSFFFWPSKHLIFSRVLLVLNSIGTEMKALLFVNKNPLEGHLEINWTTLQIAPIEYSHFQIRFHLAGNVVSLYVVFCAIVYELLIIIGFKWPYNSTPLKLITCLYFCALRTIYSRRYRRHSLAYNHVLSLIFNPCFCSFENKLMSYNRKKRRCVRVCFT